MHVLKKKWYFYVLFIKYDVWLFNFFFRTPKVKDNVCKEQPSSSGLSARSIRHNQRALFKSTGEHVDDGNSIVSHEGHMSEEESGDEVMFREEDRSNAQHKSRIPIPVNGLFSSHVVSILQIIVCKPSYLRAVTELEFVIVLSSLIRW